MSSWRVILSQNATRRKAFHYVINPQVGIVRTESRADELFDWLADHGPEEFELQACDRLHRVRWVDRSPSE